MAHSGPADNVDLYEGPTRPLAPNAWAHKAKVVTQMAAIAATGIACGTLGLVAARKRWITAQEVFEWSVMVSAGWAGLVHAKHAMFGARSDGELIEHTTAMRRMMPFIMEKRNESNVPYGRALSMAKTLPFIDEWNATHDHSERIGLIHMVIAAVMRATLEHPALNRFIVNNEVYRRHGVQISFAAKSERRDTLKKAALRTVKIEAIPGETFLDLMRRINTEITTVRTSKKRTASEQEMHLLLRLPSWALRLLVKGQRLLDSQGMWPAAAIKIDPLYASVFLADLNSVSEEEMPEVWHHLYEYGTVTLFGAINSLDRKNQTCTIRWMYDERVGDATACLDPLISGKGYLQNPTTLLEPLSAERIRAALQADVQAERCALARENNEAISMK